MEPSAAPWRQCPALREKPEVFLDTVAAFLAKLEVLNADQRQRLALFKAAELINAVMQIRERRDDPERVGAELAKTSFDRVRAVIRNRSIPLAGSEIVDLHDPALQALIDEGCRLFHLGKTDPDINQRALALSAAQCIALHHELGDALERYRQGCGFALPASLISSVREAFITAYAWPDA